MNDVRVRPRWLTPVLEKALGAFPVVVVAGARQTGKSTLVERLLPSAANRAYRTLDDLRVLALVEQEPDLLVREADQMTIDEVQRAPDLLRAIKRAVDERRRKGRFLLTGSANLLLMQRISETLAGRAVYLRLGPLTEGEKAAHGRAPPWGSLLSAPTPKDALSRLAATAVRAWEWEPAACEGGYPPVLDLDPEDRARWFEGYVATYIERDLQQLAGITALADFRRLMKLAAERLGGLLNRADLARDAALTRPTAHRYINLLEVSFQARLLPPYARNRSKRLVKSPKLYWTDTGLAAHLAGLAAPADVRASPRSGALLENLVLADLDAWRETIAPRPEILFWRTADGAEVDFVIEQRDRILPLEVKSTSRPRPEHARGLEGFLDLYRSAPFGLLVHTGSEVTMLSPRVIAVPLAALLLPG